MVSALKKRTLVNGVRPNEGLIADYHRRLQAMVDKMHTSVAYWILAKYRAKPPEMALDASPAAELQAVIRAMTRQWNREFAIFADGYGRRITRRAAGTSDAAFAAHLRKAGFTIPFVSTPELNDVLQASINQNVQLIRSIPQQYMADVGGDVMRAVQSGRDLSTISKDLRSRYDITQKRAALISRDQVSKASTAFTRARQLQIGIREAVWVHSHAGKVPRPTHVDMDGKTYDIEKGMWDEAVQRWIHPGEEINCFPSETLIDSADGVEKAYRRRYRGELTTIITSSGKSLSATPNHPILTANGWVAIGLLCEGDHVIELGDHSIDRRMVERDKDDAIPSIADVFEAIEKSGLRRSELSAGDQFHGDGSADGDVEIVSTAGDLILGRQACRNERRKHFSLAVTPQTTLHSSAPLKFNGGAFCALDGVVGGLGQAVTSFRALAIHSDLVRVPGGSQRSPSEKDALRDRASRDGVQFRESQDAEASLVLQTQEVSIVKVERSPFDGHVYNLQTRDGWYIAGGLVVHNCRCFSKAIVPGFN
jgi:hypothetical protein